MRGMIRRGLGLLLAMGLVVAPAACGGDAGGRVDAADGVDATPGDPAGRDAAERDTARADTAGATSSSSPGETVELWFSRAEAPVAVERRVAEAEPAVALEALVRGPTAAERAEGLSSWFSDSTRNVLRSVRLEDGFLVVDFRDLPTLIPNASTSAGSQDLLASLDSTTLQFARVDSVEYRLDGSCDAFWEWLQRGCEVVRRR